MKRKVKKILIYAFIGALALLFGVVLSMDEPFVMRANVMDVFPEYDLGIEKVTLQKIADASPEFDYSRYTATVIFHNYGSDIVDRKIVLHGDENQKHVFVFNTNYGFSLPTDSSYIVRNYEVLIGKNASPGKLTFEANLTDVEDKNPSNDIYTLNI